MSQNHIEIIAKELSVQKNQVAAGIKLMDEGATIPFMARYRKEMTGNLEETQLTHIRDRVEQLRQLDKRREAILGSLEERNLLNDELRNSIEAAQTMSGLEDIYLPFRPKRRTRATIAREKGLEPLAKLLFEQGYGLQPSMEAGNFIDAEKGVADAEEALQGARDIIAEWISEDVQSRASIRNLYLKEAQITAKLIAGKEEEGAKYKDYFDWSEPLSKIPSHRLLALRRAEKELIIQLTIAPAEDDAIYQLEKIFIKADNAASDQVAQAIEDGYKRLLSPSIETEVRLLTKEKADEEAIKVFTDNLRQLLMASPAGEKRVMAIDPGFRTGCKVVCLDAQGKLLEYTAIFPHPPMNRAALSEATVYELVQKHAIQIVAIGNGTAGRETETFLRSLHLPKEITIVMVNESGASVYSASEVAREEFPEHDITVRGAVSIGRRLMDPLAELVKIDPKSIGVGQYQHDVDQNQLKQSLDDTVMSCVNAVGVEVNTASKELLTYVSGLGPSLAKNIVEYRNTNGPFKSRKELMKVARMGAKAFEQAAGFLRIREAENPLDASAVHPESYHIVDKMASAQGVNIQTLMHDESLRKKIRLDMYVDEKVGLPTLQDIMNELAKPGRDPRAQFEVFSFDERVNSMEDLQEGMVLPGIVTNIVDFGAFVDIGVHQDGLIHLSQITHRFIKHPNEVLKVSQRVNVRVMSVDVARKRINLSMKSEESRSTSTNQHTGGGGNIRLVTKSQQRKKR